MSKNPLDDAQKLLASLLPAASGELHSGLEQLAGLITAGQEQLSGLVTQNAQFVSVMVHEIRVPMTSIKGYSDMLAKNIVGELNEQQMQFMDTIRNNVSRMEHLVSDISDISKIVSGRMRLDPKMDMYKNIALKVEKETADLVTERGHTLVFDTPQGLPLLNLDTDRLAQALQKMVVNALNYTPENNEIIVRAEDVEGKLKVSVIDPGIGMSEEDQAHLGELFWRADAEHVRSFKGHGLGIPIAKGFVELLGGEFFFESKEGEGSTFGFVVPGMS